MSADKSSGKSTATGKPFVAGDARLRRGRGPKKGAPNAGRPPDAFKAEMRQLASSSLVLARLQDILAGPTEHDVFLKALTFVTDRGYGRAQQHVDVTSDGQALTREHLATMNAAEIREEIARRIGAT